MSQPTKPMDLAGFIEHTILKPDASRDQIKKLCSEALENHFVDFAHRDDMDDGKLVDILRKTWGKMSERGQSAALELVLPDEASVLIQKALSS